MDLGTLALLGEAGLRAVAVDLPGTGASGPRADHESDADFMAQVLADLGMRRYD